MKTKFKKYFWTFYLIIVVGFVALCFNVGAGPTISGGSMGEATLTSLGLSSISSAQWTGLGGATTAGMAIWDDATLSAVRATLSVYSYASADATFEVQLNNAAGLYAVLSDVTAFIEADTKFTGGITIQEFVNADTTPDVSNAALGVNNVYRVNNSGDITDFDDVDDHSEFSNGDWFLLIVDDATSVVKFNANANIEGNSNVDYTGSASQIVLLLFVYFDARWNCPTLNSGFSDPITFAPSFINMAAGVVAMPNNTNPTTDAVGEMSLDETDGGQDPLLLEAYDVGVGDASRIIGTDIHCESFTILEPDVAQAACDDIKLKHFIAEAYPHGATIIAIHVATDGTDISDTFLFERWDDADGSNQVTVESIALSSADIGEDNGVDAGAITADYYLNLNLDDASDDYKSVTVTIAYRINPGD